MLKFISLSSGSSGNCYYIGDDSTSILIDAGIGVRTIKKRLLEYGIEIESIDFILVTHDHSDHIRHLGSVCQRYMKPVLATNSLFKYLDSNRNTKGRINSFRRVLDKEIPFVYKNLSITAFEVPHDANENLGYFIDFGGEKFTFLTDIGSITARLIEYCKISNHIIIESNYDVNMLLNGGYPDYLIDRIKGGRGHLSNIETAKAIQTIYSANSERLRNIFLCHLSDNNNTPELAYECSYNSLCELGVSVGEDVNLYCLPRRDHICYCL